MPKLTQAEREAHFERFVSGLPDFMQATARRFHPFQDYRIKETGQRCMIASYDEVLDEATKEATGDVTMTVYIRPEWVEGRMIGELLPDTLERGYKVFGYWPDDLEPWEEPAHA